MVTKIEAAKIATNAGVQCYYFKWNIRKTISHLCSKIGKGSLFKAKTNPKNSRKQWISAALELRKNFY